MQQPPLEPEADTPAATVRSGDLGALTLTQLAEAGNFTAVALAARPQLLAGDAAYQTLAEHADNPEASSWLWALLPQAPNPTFYSVLGRVPQDHRPPAEVQPAVREFILMPEATAGVQDPLADHRASLFARLDPTCEFTLELAREAARAHQDGDGATAARAVLRVALDLLVASTVPDDRDMVLDIAGRPGADEPFVPHPDVALALLWRLEPPYRDEETDALLAVVHAVLSQLPAGTMAARQPPRLGVHPQIVAPQVDVATLTQLRALLGRLPFADFCSALGTPALEDPGRRQMLLGGGALLQALGGGTEKQIIHAAGEGHLAWSYPLVDDLLADTAVLADPDAGDLAVLAHRHLPGSRLQQLRQRYLAAAQPDQAYGERRRAQAILLRCALADPPAGTEPSDQEVADQVLRDASQAHAAGELQQGGAVFLESPARQRLGRLLGLRYAAAASGEEATDTGNEIFAVLYSLDDDGQAQLLAGLLSRPLPAGRLPEPVVQRLSSNAVARRMLLRYGNAKQMIGDQADRMDPFQVLTDLVTADDASAQPQVLPAPNQVPAPASDLELLTCALDWADLEQTSQRRQAIAMLSTRPRLLEVALAQQIDTLSGAAADAAPPDRLAALLDEYLSTVGDKADELTTEIEFRSSDVELLLSTGNHGLHQLAARWLEHLPPTADFVELARAADAGTVLDPSPFAAARRRQASRLAEQARDRTAAPIDRAAALRLAVAADPGQARDVALDLAGDTQRPVRQAALEVLSSVPVGPEHDERLRQLRGMVTERQDRDLLDKIRRRIVSGDVGQALINMVDLAGLGDSMGPPDVGVCLLDDRVHARFRAEVDDARRAENDSPRSRVNRLVGVTELLVELAVAADWRSGNAQQRQQAEDLVANAPGKQTAGALLGQQQLLQDIPWLVDAAAIWKARSGHPAPRGSTEPRSVTDREVRQVQALLPNVVEGWVGDAYRRAGQQIPQP